MLKILGIFLLLSCSCTPLKRAQTGLARAIAGSTKLHVNGHEVYCSEGKVCSEIDVLSINAEDKDKGRVKVLLKNRTGNTALIQIRLQLIADNGEIVSETRAENVAIKPTEEKLYDMPGFNKKGAKIVVLLNVAH